MTNGLLEHSQLHRNNRAVQPPSFLFVHVNQRCNLRCEHCAFWKRNDSDRANYLSWTRKAEILREFAELSPDGSVVICGGESMLDLDDYFAITTECRHLSLRSLSVINGTRVQSGAIAERMILEGPDEISVSLNSHSESVHDSSRGVPGSFRKAVTALRLLLQARQHHPEQKARIYVMGLIYDDNYPELEAFYDFVLNDIKADKLKLNFLQPSFGWDQPIDPFFAAHHKVDSQLLLEVIRKCDLKYKLHLNPVWLEQVGMYFRSLNSTQNVELGWGARAGTTEHICNSYRRNVIVDLYGTARLCFSHLFPGMKLANIGDLRCFWETSDYIRDEMMRCNRFCGISHSVRRESSTLFPRRPSRSCET